MSRYNQRVFVFIPKGKQSIVSLVVESTKLSYLRAVKFLEEFLVAFSLLNPTDIVAYFPTNLLCQGFQEVACFF